ncbi:hypothetical protein FRC00_005047 [Tulasnella sp. 408]|nr:hypothetical protein FRC00_005047 [Tulasnella sp. 408]
MIVPHPHWETFMTYEDKSKRDPKSWKLKLLLCLAEVYCIEKPYDNAVETSNQTTRISSEEGLAEPFVDTLNHLGEVYRLTESYADAAEAFHEAGEIAAQEDYLDGNPQALNGVGMMFADEENDEEVVKHLE